MQADYAKAFRVIRAAFGLTQAELAQRLPITASQLSLIEAGKRQPSLRVVEGLASAVGAPTALISLLASPPPEAEAPAGEDFTDLAKALLKLLVSAREGPQRALAFKD